MQYLVKNIDNSVVVVTLFPIGVVRKTDNKVFAIVGQRRKGNDCIIYGFNMEGNVIELRVGDINYDIADLKENTLNDYEIVFPDMEKDIISKWVLETKNKVASIRIMEKSEIPQDRYFRDAWIDNGKVEVDMAKAKEIHKEKLRRLRTKELEELDIKYQKADENNDTKKKAEVVDRKQVLRDLPNDPAIELATTPEELKTIGLDKLL